MLHGVTQTDIKGYAHMILHPVAVFFTALFVSAMPASAPAFASTETENERFLADLNVHTTKASRIVIYGRLLLDDKSRPGPMVTIRGRGPLVEIAGASFYRASYVVVGTPCELCRLEVRRYHTGSGQLDDIIAVYHQPKEDP